MDPWMQEISNPLHSPISPFWGEVGLRRDRRERRGEVASTLDPESPPSPSHVDYLAVHDNDVAILGEVVFASPLTNRRFGEWNGETSGQFGGDK